MIDRLDCLITGIVNASEYLVRSDGVVIGKKGSPLKPYVGKGNYLQVDLFVGGRKHTKKIHRLIAETFLPRIEGKETVNHIDGHKGNNALSNLEWLSMSGNIEHSFAMGLHNCPRKPVAQLDCAGTEIARFESMKAASRALVVSPRHISRACKTGWKAGGYRWKALTQAKGESDG